MKAPSEKVKEYKPSPTDLLAMERTVMANERTLLAYVRTSLTFFIPGVTGVQFADSLLLEVVSFLFIPLGIVVFITGIYRFRKKRKENRLILQQTPLK